MTTAERYRKMAERFQSEAERIVEIIHVGEPFRGKANDWNERDAYLVAATALREAAEMRETLESLVTKLDAIDRATRGIFALAAVHGSQYTGPTWVEEITRARAILGTNGGQS